VKGIVERDAQAKKKEKKGKRIRIFCKLGLTGTALPQPASPISEKLVSA
jgi:hypothetical protein